MATSDRTQLKQQVAAAINDLRTVAAAPLGAGGCVAQDAQRYVELCLTGGTAANASANYSLARLDRPVTVKELRLLPAGAVTVNGNTTFLLGYTNDGGGALVNVAVFNTNANANIGTGNLAQWVSVNITSTIGLILGNLAIPSGSHLVLRQVGTAPSEALAAGTTFQVIWEET